MRAAASDSLPDDAILLIRTSAGRELVAAACRQAVAGGVRSGMTVAHARALLSDCPIRCFPFDPEADGAALERLARWALRLAPRVMPDGPDGLLLDITGCERLFRGEWRFMNTARNALEWLGFDVRIACAETIGAAWAVARSAPEACTCVPEGGLRRALSPLSIEMLRLAPESVAGLREVGIDRIEQLLAVPRLELAERFARPPGATGLSVLARLEMALGERAEPMVSVTEQELLRVGRNFDGPVRDPAAIRLAAQGLLDELATQLRAKEAGVRRLHLGIVRSDLPPWHETITLSHPSREPRHLLTLLDPRLERLPMGFGVERIELVAAECGRLRHDQIELTGARDATPFGTTASKSSLAHESAAGELIDVLTQWLGPRRVVRAVSVASHLSESTFRAEPMKRVSRKGAVDPSMLRLRDRPSRLLPVPEGIEVTMDDAGHPAAVGWQGATHQVVQWIGPERIGEAWWRGPRHETALLASTSTRAYYRVQSDGGRWFWIFHLAAELGGVPPPDTPAATATSSPGRSPGQWFLHGEWS